METKRKILCVADAHILETPGAAGGFFDMLARVAETEYDIVFLGDIFELWIAFDSYETEIHKRFLAWCRAEKTKRRIGFVEGNHEFYVSERYRDAFTWCTDRSRLISDGRVCLMHGDTINEDDVGYLLMRRVLRNPLSRVLVRLFGPLAGKVLSEKIRLSLKGKNLKHKKNFPTKYLGQLADRMEEKQISLCLMGHFHQTAALRGIRILPAWNPDGEIGLLDPESGQFTVRSWKQILNVG